MADTDISNFLRGLQRAGNAQVQRALQGVDRFGAMVLGDAQDEAPVDHGDLKASATDLPAEIVGGAIVKRIGFNEFYAAMVHEILTAHHSQGRAKYLEIPLRAGAEKFGPYVAGYVKAGAQ